VLGKCLGTKCLRNHCNLLCFGCSIPTRSSRRNCLTTCSTLVRAQALAEESEAPAWAEELEEPAWAPESAEPAWAPESAPVWAAEWDRQAEP